MKELVLNFQRNKEKILNKLLKQFKLNRLSEIKSENLDEAFLHFEALETIYAVDKDFLQLSPIFNKSVANDNFVNNNLKKTLKDNTHMGDKKYFISSPHISKKTNKYTITFVKKIEDRYLALDFDLFKLLKEFNCLDKKSKLFINGVKFIYSIIGFCLTIFSLILIFYALYNFINHLFIDSSDIFQSIFKSTIGLTLGLAIFDLAKNLLEHEVIFKDNINEEHGGNRLLIKFLTSIMIALSIESLMLVFKIAISDYKDILYAVYLILAIGFLLISMSQFNKYLSK